MNFLKKSIASILTICLIGLLVGPLFLFPKTAKAMCPVNVSFDKTETVHMGKQEAWESLKQVFRTGSLAKATVAAYELVKNNATQLATWSKNVFLNLLLHQILSMITNDIVAWIQNGQKPRFLTMGLDDYLWRATNEAGGNFIDQYLGAGWLCEPFDMDIKLAFVNAPITFDEKARCSLSDIVDNIYDFYDDFSKGGWKGWIELTQPRNNFYGAFLMARDEYNLVQSKAKEEAEKDAMMGEGFLSPKDCTWRDATGRVVAQQNDVWGHPSLPQECKPEYAEAAGVITPCTEKCTIKTPSSVVSEMTKKATTNFYDQINAQIAGATANAGPFQIYVTSIVNALINRVMREGLAIVGIGEVPNEGDSGAAASIPRTLIPETVMGYKNSAIELIDQLELLKDNLNNQLLEEQQNNLALLTLISAAYAEDIPALEDVAEECEGTNYSSYVTWAEDKISELNNSTTPELAQRISDMENNQIPNTLSWIDYINTAVSSVQGYTSVADEWIDAYRNTGGNQRDPMFIQAEADIQQAENNATTDVQKVITEINGAVASSDFNYLISEIEDASFNTVILANYLISERGYVEWPDAGTLYAELEAARAIKTEALTKKDQCESWSSLIYY